MRCVVQRVKSASVTVDGAVISSIGHGLCVLVGLSGVCVSVRVCVRVCLCLSVCLSMVFV